MTKSLSTFTHLADDTLLDHIKRLAEHERHATADLIAALSEVDARRLYLGQGCSSRFTYCTRVLRLSEHAAYRRIEAARVARRYPVVIELLEEGSINLTTLGLLTSHLTTENHHELLESAKHKSRRDVEHLAASLRPQPPAPTVIRRLPSPKPATTVEQLTGSPSEPTLSKPASDQAATAPAVAVTPPRRGLVAPLAPDRYKVQVTVSRETYDKLRRAQDLLRHTIPNGDPAAIFDRALTLLLLTLERDKLGASTRCRGERSAPGSSRHVPASVRRQVWARDAGRCAFVGAMGRCTERGFLEFHHVVPFAAGGKATVENLELRCRAHNAYESELFFGPLIVREPRARWLSSV